MFFSLRESIDLVKDIIFLASLHAKINEHDWS